MNKKIMLPLGITLAGIVAIAGLVLLKPKPKPAPLTIEDAKVKVQVAPAELQTLRLSVSAQGSVTPLREIDLVAEVSGRVVAVEPAFIDGGFFANSEVLLHIEESDYRAAHLQAQARVADAQYRLSEEMGLSRQAKREWRDLGNQNANDLFLRKPQLAAARANLASAEGELQRAALDLESTRITVPFNGRVKETFVDLGEFVTVGSRLATVYDSSAVEIRLPLTESQAALLDLPLLPNQLVEKPLVQITASVAGTRREWQGVLARTDAFVDAGSRMYYGVVEVENPFEGDVPLLPGIFVEAEIGGKQLSNVMKLPRSALFKRDRLLTLDANNNVQEQRVTVLRRTVDFVWLQADIPENTLIALEKQSLTPQGATVDPFQPDQAEKTVVTDTLDTDMQGVVAQNEE